MQPQQFEGYWTLAGSDTQVPGRLTFSPEHGVVLTLNGAFDSDDPFRVDDSYYTIHGVTAANRRVTLVRCLRRTSVMASGYSTAEYSSPGMVIGCHFPSDEAMKFKQLSVSYYNQEEIFGESGIREELTVAAPGTVDITLSYKKPDPLRAQLGDFLIETRYAWGVEGDRWEGRRIRQRAWLTASSDGGRHLNDFLGGPMRSLHTLMELAAVRHCR